MPLSDSRSVAGATTVVGGDVHSTIGKDFGAHFDAGASTHISKLAPGIKSNKDAPSAPFVIAADYASQTRPYFVNIDKDGVIPALQKLDMEMRNVGSHVNYCFTLLIAEFLV